MKSFLLRTSLLLLSVVCGVAKADADASVLIEPETETRFPTEVTFVEDGTRYRLSATGAAVRKKFWFNVYSVAHYLEDGAKATQAEVLASIVSDDTAKQVTLEFARDLRAEQVREGFLESFTEHASAEEMSETQAPLRVFLRSIDADVVEHDRLDVRWLPGGRLVFIYNEKPVLEISNRPFAHVFWAMYFGEASIVDRRRLVALRLRPAP